MFEKLRFRFKNIITPKEVEKAYYEMREALRRKALDGIGADVYGKRATSTGELISQLENVDEATLRLGDVLVVKTEIDGKTHIIAETISPSLARDLETKPMLKRDPKSLFCLIDSKDQQGLLNSKATHSSEGETQKPAPIKIISNEIKPKKKKPPAPIKGIPPETKPKKGDVK